ncbi:MAG: YeeE/YedE family protein [Alphaproteobacteria bacterium]|nr:YeeE/YedE family protein [Alphaproteobacteria bacterium]
MRFLSAYLIGLVFGVGIVVSGMANPAKVLNFFDVAGTWDPSLIFVMGGALAVAALGYRFVLRRPAPVLAETFQVPTRRDLDVRLIVGAAVFGIGWGIAGFCPGGALPALGTGRVEVAIFVAAVIAGIGAARILPDLRRGPRRPTVP